MDDAFAEAKHAFNGRVRFIKLEFTGTDGEDAAKEFSVEKAPAVVLTDSKGRVVEKIEGKISVVAMSNKLKALMER